MGDLRDRLRALDSVTPPDQWEEIRSGAPRNLGRRPSIGRRTGGDRLRRRSGHLEKDRPAGRNSSVVVFQRVRLSRRVEAYQGSPAVLLHSHRARANGPATPGTGRLR